MELTGGAQRVRPYDLGAIGVYPETATSIYLDTYCGLYIRGYANIYIISSFFFRNYKITCREISLLSVYSGTICFLFIRRHEFDVSFLFTLYLHTRCDSDTSSVSQLNNSLLVCCVKSNFV
jgi:hypothetical protein